MNTTANFNIPKPEAGWFDQHPGCGAEVLVAEVLDSIDAALAAKLKPVSEIPTPPIQTKPHLVESAKPKHVATAHASKRRRAS